MQPKINKMGIWYWITCVKCVISSPSSSFPLIITLITTYEYLTFLTYNRHVFSALAFYFLSRTDIFQFGSILFGHHIKFSWNPCFSFFILPTIYKDDIYKLYENMENHFLHLSFVFFDHTFIRNVLILI